MAAYFVPMISHAEVLGTFPFDEPQPATMTLSTAPLPGSVSNDSPKASDGRVMRLLIRIQSKDKKWLRSIDGVTVQANMPQHEHGMLVTPKPSIKIREGVFAIDGVQFHMEGEWLIRIRTRHSSLPIEQKNSDSATIQIKISSAK